ncbi:hypothetical protein BaRGS_00007851 [Batillaria attramentaria]|uniref:Uncharacterized protein n=1 Tax=Batillaria attramentaria TaxID=370345 RepID=A0ABD0LNW9_9CAEN
MPLHNCSKPGNMQYNSRLAVGGRSQYNGCTLVSQCRGNEFWQHHRDAEGLRDPKIPDWPDDNAESGLTV